MKKTKIICTIGPASNDIEILRKMIESGMDVARFNLSHATEEQCKEIIAKIHQLEDEYHKAIGIMMDMNGPEVRLGEMTDGKCFLKEGSHVKIVNRDILGTNQEFSVNYCDIISLLHPNMHLLLSDGKVSLKVQEQHEDYVVCEVEQEGPIYSNRTVHFPDSNLQLDYLSTSSKEDIRFAVSQKIDFLALSFVRDHFDVLDVNDYLIELGDDNIQLISKIENNEAIDDLDEIIKHSDGIMVARGDLGVEVPIEKLPGLQKMMLQKVNVEGKIGIVATELLSTMENDNLPTKAEITDVYNAVIDGSDAVMLSGETTIGNFPVETVEMMNKIIKSAEEDINYIDLLDDTMFSTHPDITSCIAHSVVDSANRLKVQAIVTSTNSGNTAKKISRFRPRCPIVATSPNRHTVRSLTLYFGIYPKLIEECHSTDEIVDSCKKTAIDMLHLKNKDYIIITGGFPVNCHKTNFMKIEEI